MAQSANKKDLLGIDAFEDKETQEPPFVRKNGGLKTNWPVSKIKVIKGHRIWL